MSYLDRLDDRIAELGRLEANWDSYGAKTIDESALAWLREVREVCARGGIKVQLHFYPTPSGGAQFEFDAGPFAVSAQFFPSTKLVEYGATHVRGPMTDDIDATVSTMPELIALVTSTLAAAEVFASSPRQGASK